MSRIILFSGTSEGRQLSEALEAAGIPHLVCVATHTGADVMQPGSYARIHEGRLNAGQMQQLALDEQAEILADATHPYADVVSRTIRECADALHLSYIRVIRRSAETADDRKRTGVRFFDDALQCREALLQTEGNILLTTGSKQLSFFAEPDALKERLFARVLPTAESLKLCSEAGIDVKHVIAMFGPFSEAMNTAMLSQYRIRVMVTKESGKAGGFPEKLRSAQQAGCTLFVIGRPSQEEGVSWQEAARMLGAADVPRQPAEEQPAENPEVEIDLIGIGMGDEATLTLGGKAAIEQAHMILGAERMIAPYRERFPEKEFVCEYRPDRMLDAIRKRAEQERRTWRVAVLYSGDCGFYSGAAPMRKRLEAWSASCSCPVTVRQIAGISSFSYFSAALGVSYAEAALESWHGHSDEPARERLLVKAVQERETCFLLLSGVADVQRLGRVLLENRLEQCKIFLGAFLGSPRERIDCLTPQQAQEMTQEGLYIAMIRNPSPGRTPVVQVLGDEAFLRDRTPMTKEEIRHLSVLKLELTPNAILYDIGAGTGSVSCEAAGIAPGIRVYAIEQKEGAAELLRRNVEHLHAANVTVVEGKAPAAMEGLPAPTHAFVGGSSGQLRQILELLRKRAPGIRVVVNAISLETLGEILTCAKEMQFTPELVQIQASRSHAVGAYHLVKAENPIWIAAFSLAQDLPREET